MPDSLAVHLDGVHVGSLTQSSQGALGFQYDAAYANAPDVTPLSLAMPLRGGRVAPRVARAWFDGLLPDNDATRRRWAQQFGVSANNPFALLRHVGRDAAGAVQVLPQGVDSGDAGPREGEVEVLDDDAFTALVHALATHRRDWDDGRGHGRWSLAGAQAKVALHRDPATGRWGLPRDATPTTHIVKPAIEGFADHHVNEVVCQRTAAALGIPAAAAELLEVGDVQAVVSTRYDRALDATGGVVRLHQEDLCQALGVPPAQKYQADGGPGLPDIADLFARLDARDRDAVSSAFLDALGLNLLLGGTDAHAKNYSLLLRQGRVRMAPLYDLASIAPYDDGRLTATAAPGTHSRAASAMKVGDHWEMAAISATDWSRTARRFRRDPELAVERLRQLHTDLPDALQEAVASLPADVRARGERIAERVVAHARSVPAARRPG